MFKKSYLFLILLITSCGSNQESPENTKITTKDDSLLSTESIKKIGRTHGIPGKLLGPKWDPTVEPDIDPLAPYLPKTVAGVMPDGIYYVLFNTAEGLHTKILEKELETKKYGVLHVSDSGRAITEWRFGENNQLSKRSFSASGDGNLVPQFATSCKFAYFPNKYIIETRAHNGVKITEYCDAQSGDAYEKAGITDHHELWSYLYAPYELKK